MVMLIRDGWCNSNEVAEVDRRVMRLSHLAHQDAKCLDGSKAGYYYRAGTDGWVIYLEDAGWCFTEEECRKRSLTPQGSSLSWPDMRDDLGGVTSGSGLEDPDMSHWSKVIVPSCDGSSFISNRSAPLVGTIGGDESLVWLRGANIVWAVVQDLETRYQVSGRVLIAGSASGALGVLTHIDALAKHLAGRDVVGLADSVLIPMTVAGMLTEAVPLFIAAAALWEPVLPLHGCGEKKTRFSNPSRSSDLWPLAPATANSLNTTAWQCLFASRIAAHIASPLYVVQATHDCVHMELCLSPHQERLKVKHALLMYAAKADANAEELKAVWEAEVRALAAPLILSKKDGVYLNSCAAHKQALTNCGMQKGTGSRTNRLNLYGKEVLACSVCGGFRGHYVRVGCQLISVREAFGDWYFSFYWKGSFAEYAKVIDRIQGGNNPSCTIAEDLQGGQIAEVDNITFQGDEL